MSKNGWTSHLVTGIGRDDFLSLDEEEALKPRDIYGGLPRRFGRLAADSKMVDAGSAQYDIPETLLADFPFLRRTITGTARDLGPYERPAATDPGVDAIGHSSSYQNPLQSDIPTYTYDLQGRRLSGSPSSATRKGLLIVVKTMPDGTRCVKKTVR
ncbi:MAG: hypothetical protein IKZ48_02050 [Prevotella sp.]|nr:hypothetical protein [Prevotella sp.]